ncbi:MAG: hypothetical protein KC656_15290 [Myxococcales bacterium]|nr:hypothetical protein [Myxococcales bacterium]MCA9569212.1 hypothetical protein [Myxococcales bacterium]
MSSVPVDVEPSGLEARVLDPVVDALGWADTDRDVAAWLRRAYEPDGLFAGSVLAGTPLPPDAPVHAAEVTVERDSDADAWLRIREAVVFTNPSDATLDRLQLRVVANGRGHAERSTVVLGCWVDGVAVPTALDGPLLTIPLPYGLRPGRRARVLLHLAEPIPPSDARQQVGTDTLWPDQTGAFAEDDGYLVLGSLLPTVLSVGRDGRWDTRVLAANADPAVGPPSLFRVTLDAPTSLTPVSTGVSLGRISDERRATELMVAAGARDFSVVLVPEASVLKTAIGSTRLRVVVSGEAVSGPDLLRVADDALRSMIRHFGPLTQREIDVVEAPARAVDGLDWPGLVLVDASHKGRPYHLSASHEWALAHGLGHQWWGHEVGNDGLADPWFDEGLATHAASLYWEDLHGRDAVLDRHEVEAIEPLAALRDRGFPDLPALLPPDAYDRGSYGLVVHQRTALFLDLARQAFGAETWDALLFELHVRGVGRVMGQQDVLDLLRARAPSTFDVDAAWTRWMAEGHAYEDLLGPR